MLDNHSIKKSYIVCSTMRTGSTLLCSILSSLGDCGHATEYFNPYYIVPKKDYYDNPDKSFIEYYSEVVEKATTSNGVLGIKEHWPCLSHLLRTVRNELSYLKESSDLDIIEQLFPNPHFIYISRHDILDQAISISIAQQTGMWIMPASEEFKAQKSKLKQSYFKPDKIYRHKSQIRRNNQSWESFFKENSIEPYRIVYEDFVRGYGSEIQNIYKFLGIDFRHEAISLPLKKQADRTNFRHRLYYQMIPEILIRLSISEKPKKVFENSLSKINEALQL